MGVIQWGRYLGLFLQSFSQIRRRNSFVFANAFKMHFISFRIFNVSSNRYFVCNAFGRNLFFFSFDNFLHSQNDAVTRHFILAMSQPCDYHTHSKPLIRTLFHSWAGLAYYIDKSKNVAISLNVF